MKPSPAEAHDEVVRFIEGMTGEERMLVVLRHELYEDNWEDMIADLTARLDGRPYIFKLVHRIEDDLRRMERLREFEDIHGVDLSEYVDLEA